MTTEKLIHNWFHKWETGDYMNLPVTDSFTHTSPFGTIKSKKDYLKLVSDNKDKFLGYKFIMEDELYASDRACVRYKALQSDFELSVSEWYYLKGDLIESIYAYYHIGDIAETRKLK